MAVTKAWTVRAHTRRRPRRQSAAQKARAKLRKKAELKASAPEPVKWNWFTKLLG